MNNLQDNTDAKFLDMAIRVGIERWFDRYWEEQKKRMLEQFETEKSAALASVVLHATKMMDIQTYADRLIITLRNETK